MRLVDQVHKEVINLIRVGDLAIDATIGNGHDTLLLAKSGAQVIGFDIQDLAIQNTKNRLINAGLLDKVSLHKVDHSQMQQSIPQSWPGNLRVVMFNLGYLPGGDKTVITRPNSTLAALNSAYNLLAMEGYLSIVLYPDHEGGNDEATAVKSWIAKLNKTIQHLRPSPTRGPEWFLLQKN